MKRYFQIFVSSLLAGGCIVLGATCYLMCAIQGGFGFKLAGSFMFGIGLFTIIHYGYWLYTGKVGYLLENKPRYILELLVCLCGNLIGVILLSLLIKLSGATSIVGASGKTIEEFCKVLVENKQNEKWYQVIILSLLCGVMIYLAVDGHKRAPYAGAKIIFAFMPISLFILLGFEHVVANACYYTYAGVFNLKVVLWFFLMALGDGLGSIFVYLGLKLVNYLGKPLTPEEEKHIKENSK